MARNLTTLFGTVRYWRMYMREVSEGNSGYHPLYLSLGLGVSARLLDVCAPYSAVTVVLLSSGRR